MANNRYFDFIEIEYDKLTEQINNWLRYTYNKADIVFNSASPYGQLINVMKELFQQNLLYLKNSMKMLNIETSTNKKVIQSIARIAGHSVGRAISATGTLKFKLKPGADIKEIKDGVISIPNKLKIKNKTNSLYYVAKLNQDNNFFSITTHGMEFHLPIIQGTNETQTFTGDGTINQSFSVNIPNAVQVENFNYKVTLNTIVLDIKESLYDMQRSELACIVKSGFNGGIDIYFGTDNYGVVPGIGSIITVEYVLSNGSAGEILNPKINDWKIEGEILDGQGNIVNKIEELFDVFIYQDINFASDGESIYFTKSIVPYVSRNFILSTPKQFIFHLRRMNIFSQVNAFNMLDDNNFGITSELVEKAANNITSMVSTNKSNDEIKASVANFKTIYDKYKTNMNDNTIFLFLIPDIMKYFNDGVNYFNIPFDVFYLDEYEQQKTLSYLKRLGTMSITTSVKIVQPIISRYTIHVYVRSVEGSIIENIQQEIIMSTSAYLLVNSRTERIPKSDFIQMYKDIDGIDSVSLYFISEKNEDFHKKEIDTNKPVTDIVVGLDPVHGDIIIEKDEYAVIRGGFRDRNGIWYSEDPNDISLSSINVTFDGVTEN